MLQYVTKDLLTSCNTCFCTLSEVGPPLPCDIPLNNNPSANQCHHSSQRQALPIHPFLSNVVGVPRERHKEGTKASAADGEQE